MKNRPIINDNILMVVLGIIFFLNIFMMNVFPPIIPGLVIIGHIMLGVGALLFALSVLTLRIKRTGTVIDSGVYGIVRHPMYLAAMTMFFSHIFYGQHWVVLMSTIVAIACCYLIMLSADRRNIEKFGDAYKYYMAEVPRMNALTGIIRFVRQTTQNKDKQ